MSRNPELDELYESLPYLEAYTEHTERRVRDDPYSAIGGLWEEMGALQFDFLIAQGLAFSHTLLDIGCGTLRAGRHFIAYLDAGCYAGIDLSTEAIAFANAFVRENSLESKSPDLRVNKSQELDFETYDGRKFDFLLAHSVFTHLLPEHIEKCFSNLHRIMSEESRFYFTFFPANDDEISIRNYKNVYLPRLFFEKLAEKHSLLLLNHDKDYPHPRGQAMFSVRLL